MYNINLKGKFEAFSTTQKGRWNMWKSIIVVTSLLLAISSTQIFAAGLESRKRHTTRERAERNIDLDQRMTYNNMVSGFSIDDDVSAGFIFGLDKVEQDSHEGPDDNSSGLGLGLGISFSF